MHFGVFHHSPRNASNHPQSLADELQRRYVAVVAQEDARRNVMSISGLLGHGMLEAGNLWESVMVREKREDVHAVRKRVSGMCFHVS